MRSFVLCSMTFRDDGGAAVRSGLSFWLMMAAGWRVPACGSMDHAEWQCELVKQDLSPDGRDLAPRVHSEPRHVRAEDAAHLLGLATSLVLSEERARAPAALEPEREVRAPAGERLFHPSGEGGRSFARGGDRAVTDEHVGA